MYKASDYIYKTLIEELLISSQFSLDTELTLDNAEHIYNQNAYGDDDISDLLYELHDNFRYSGTVSNLDAPCSRHFEVDMHVRQVDGVWVAWPFYYGGDKHAEPDVIDWVGQSEIVVLDREEVVVKRIFKYNLTEK